MRLSEILKDLEKPTVPIPRIEPASPVLPKPSRPAQAVPVEKKSRHDEKEIEAHLRSRLEKELLSKFEKLEEESVRRREELERAERLHRQQIEEAERRLAAREQSLDQSEKEKGEELKAAQRQIEELRLKINQKELELAEKQNQPRPVETPKPIAPPPVTISKPPAPAAAAQSPISSTPIPRAPAAPKLEPRPSLPKEAKPIFDSLSETKSRTVVNALLSASHMVLEKVSKSQTIDIPSLTKSIEELIDLTAQRDSELIRIALEPYSDASYFTGHTVNCTIFALILGMDFELKGEDLLNLGLAAFLHDVGLINVRENLDYPKQLLPEIQDEVIKHPERGAEILKSQVRDDVLAAVRQHHEAYNGKGYPAGMSGENITLFAKIIHVVDAFEALTHERPYRKKPMEVTEAMKEIIERGRGIYDPTVLKSLMGKIGLYPTGTLVELSNRQIARVINQNRQFPLSPVVQIEYDEGGTKLPKPAILNLAEQQFVHVANPVRDVPSYGKTRVEHTKSASGKKSSRWKDFVPVIFIIIALLLLVFVVLKI